MSDNRSIAYIEGNKSIYRASGIGSCVTALIAAKMGHEEQRFAKAEKIMMDAANEGSAQEGIILNTLKTIEGWRIQEDGSQDLMELKIIPNVYIRGHIDGIVTPKGMRNPRLLEVKTMSDARFKKWISYGNDARTRLLTDEFDKYAWQISAYMHHYEMPAMYVVKNRNSGTLDISEIKIPPIDLKVIRKKIIEVERLFLKGDLPTCNLTSERFFCPYPYLHNGDTFGDEDDDDFDPIDDVTSSLVEGMAILYVELAKKVSTLKPLDEERKEVGKKLLGILGTSGPKKTIAGDYQVSRVDNTYAKVDKAGIASELGINVEQYDELVKKHTQRPKRP